MLAPVVYTRGIGSKLATLASSGTAEGTLAAIDIGGGAIPRLAALVPGRGMLIGCEVAKFGVMVGFLGIFLLDTWLAHDGCTIA